MTSELRRACLTLTGIACIAAGLAGCNSTPPPNVVAQMTRTETSVAQAEQAGAQKGALPELQQAKDKHARAQEALKKKDYDIALRLAEQAQVDAQYAAAKAQTLQDRQAAADAQKSIEALRNEAKRGAQP